MIRGYEIPSKDQKKNNIELEEIGLIPARENENPIFVVVRAPAYIAAFTDRVHSRTLISNQIVGV